MRRTKKDEKWKMEAECDAYILSSRSFLPCTLAEAFFTNVRPSIREDASFFFVFVSNVFFFFGFFCCLGSGLSMYCDCV